MFSFLVLKIVQKFQNNKKDTACKYHDCIKMYNDFNIVLFVVATPSWGIKMTVNKKNKPPPVSTYFHLMLITWQYESWCKPANLLFLWFFSPWNLTWGVLPHVKEKFRKTLIYKFMSIYYVINSLIVIIGNTDHVKKRHRIIH